MLCGDLTGERYGRVVRRKTQKWGGYIYTLTDDLSCCTEIFFKKIRDTKGIFHAKMGSIKDRNCMNLTDAEDIKRRWQEYTEELYKKDLHDPDYHDGVITHLEPDNLECEVKWTLGSITMNKDSGGDVFPVELHQILKDDAVKVLHSICWEIWKTTVATGLEMVNFQSNP